MLNHNGPYAQIILPCNGGYWMDGVNSCTINIDDNFIYNNNNNNNNNSCVRYKLETDDISHCYRRYFVGKVFLLFLKLVPNCLLFIIVLITNL